MRPELALTYLALLFGIWGGRGRETATMSPGAAAPAADSATFAEWAVGELAALRDGVTPAQWLREHAGDSITPFTATAAEPNDGDRCALATGRGVLADGAPLVRHAYFYPPPPPPSLELPPDREGPTLVRRACLLGAIWVETPHRDSVRGMALARRTAAALTAAYGPITAGPDSFFGRAMTDAQKERLRATGFYETVRLGIAFFGSAAWRAPGRWERGPVIVVSAFDVGIHDESGRRVLAFAYLPHSRFAGSERFRERLDDDRVERDTAVRVAARLSGIRAGSVDSVLGLRGRQVPDSLRVAALEEWLRVARDLDAPRRAGALFIADAVVPEYLDAQDSTTRAAYERLGLRFVHSPLGGTYNYAHNQLEEALRLDSAGPAGELVMLEMLERGFNLTGMCGGGFDEVIARGEPFLRRVTTPAVSARVLFVLGHAHADIVALAGGAGGEYVDPRDFTARAPAARRAAVAYYRRALALDQTSERARRAWLEAWRLVAGLPPSRTHFFCVYD